MSNETPSDKISAQDLDKLVEDIFDQRNKIEAMNEQVSAQNKILAAMETKAVQYLDDLKRDKYQHPRGTISVQEAWSWNLPEGPENKQKFFSYLKEQGLFDKMATIHAGTYNSYLKEEWSAAQERGEGMDFTLPGVPEPKLYRKLGKRKSNE